MNSRMDYIKASPAGYKAFGGVYTYLQNSGLSKELVYLVYLRVSHINGICNQLDKRVQSLVDCVPNASRRFSQSWKCRIGLSSGGTTR